MRDACAACAWQRSLTRFRCTVTPSVIQFVSFGCNHGPDRGEEAYSVEDHMPNKQDGTEQFTAPKLVPEAEFKEIKAESVKIYAYANRVLTKACAEQEIKSWGFALFDQHGCLLKLYGPAGYLEWCRERGISKQTYYRWQKRVFEAAQRQQQVEFAEVRTSENLQLPATGGSVIAGVK